MFLHDNHHFILHPSDLGGCSVVNLSYITVSQFIYGMMVLEPMEDLV